MTISVYIGICTLALVIFIAIVLVRYYGKTKKGIDGVRDRIDGLDQANSLDHDKMAGALKKVEGRTQFLVATTIAEELSAAKAKQDTQGDKQP